MSEDGANNIAYIDAANLHKGLANLGWRLDYKRFRVWLRVCLLLPLKNVRFFLNELEQRLRISMTKDLCYRGLNKEKTPGGDEPHKGLFRSDNYSIG